MILVSCNEGNKYNVSSDESNNNNRTSLDHKNTYLNCPDENHPHMIDLGLPSGTIWSCCNVGASSPKDYGDFYAWGETKEKMKFYSNTYQFENVKIGPSISGTRYDVAHVKWGGQWQMPHLEHLQELLNYCSYEWTKVNGNYGRRFKGPNGGVIFLPAAGYRKALELNNTDKNGRYWSGDLAANSAGEAAIVFGFNSNEATWYGRSRFYGFSVRPIIEGNNSVTSNSKGSKPKSTIILCPDDNHPHIVDLGLPSGTLWACCNVGASSPKDYGGYYAWGELEEKSDYLSSTYLYNKYDRYQILGSCISATKYDVAYMNWDKSWQMPTSEQIKELIDNCTHSWIVLEGVNGVVFTGPNGGCIFLPAAGTSSSTKKEVGHYWSSTQYSESETYAHSLGFSRKFLQLEFLSMRHCGNSVRPVIIYGPTQETNSFCPDDNHPHLINLGLPSGTKWACCNVDATKPEDFGGFYAWGETKEKDEYTWGTYIHCAGSADTCLDLDDDICGTQYDVAHVKWGGSWQMPSLEQIQELNSKCKHEWINMNGIEGKKYTGPNGESIFLPAAGYRFDSDCYDHGDDGDYWTGTSGTSYSYGDGRACCLGFSIKKSNECSSNRRLGYPVRPVAN